MTAPSEMILKRIKFIWSLIFTCCIYYLLCIYQIFLKMLFLSSVLFLLIYLSVYVLKFIKFPLVSVHTNIHILSEYKKDMHVDFVFHIIKSHRARCKLNYDWEKLYNYNPFHFYLKQSNCQGQADIVSMFHEHGNCNTAS